MENIKEYKKRIAVIIAYFGDLPDNYDYWEKTVMKNDSIDFFVFTNNDKEDKKNIRFIKMTFKQYVDRIQKNFPFKIVCQKPYKLCDFRPAIGMTWANLLKDYDFWGFCDLDLLFGDIRKFLTDDILNKNDKIFITGHFSLYKNTKQMNTLFMDAGKYPEYNYEETFTTEDACYFDEFRGLDLKCIRNGIKVYHNNQLFLDMNPSKFEFVNRRGERVFCVWRDGKLVSINKDGFEEEWLYIHFQKRKMSCEPLDTNKNSFIMAPNFIKSGSQIGSYKLSGSNIYNGIYSIHYYYDRLFKNLGNYSIMKLLKRRKRQRDVKMYKRDLLLDNVRGSGRDTSQGYAGEKY